MVRLVARVIGVGIETADMLVQEVLSRTLRDRRAVARCAGLTGAPDESGRREKGLARSEQRARSARAEGQCLGAVVSSPHRERARHAIRDTQSEGFSQFVTSLAAPPASGWSDRRVGLAPTGKRRLGTAHTRNGHRSQPVLPLWTVVFR